MFVVAGWGRHLDLVDTEKTPNLAAYLKRIAARPAVKDALQAEKQGR
jgi:glutathione S-transferase